MANEVQVTVVGNATDAPEIRFTGSGRAVANWTVASTPRRYDKQSGQWVDGEPLFLRCAIWGQPAENVAETVTKGMRLVCHGTLKQRSYETREGDRRTVIEMEVNAVGPDLRYATATVNRASRDSAPAQAAMDYGNGDQPAPF